LYKIVAFVEIYNFAVRTFLFKIILSLTVNLNEKSLNYNIIYLNESYNFKYKVYLHPSLYEKVIIFWKTY
jgi:hypothetical protein